MMPVASLVVKSDHLFDLNNSLTESQLNRLRDFKIPEFGLELSKSVKINNEQFDLASDWHFPKDVNFCQNVLLGIKARKTTNTFICCGDIFDSNGCDNSAWVSQFLNTIASFYETVLFVPGNHDLRGRQEPWASFKLAENIVMPYADQPIIHATFKNKILLANLFYDLKFIDNTTIGLDESALNAEYAKTDDGRFLQCGTLSSFHIYTERLAVMLTPDVDILITHALPHPVLVEFKTLESEQSNLPDGLSNLKVTIIDEADRHRAAISGQTDQQFKDYWNAKSAYMGSNPLEHELANPKKGLVCFYGHNHRSVEIDFTNHQHQEFKFTSHQPRPNNPELWVEMLKF